MKNVILLSGNAIEKPRPHTRHHRVPAPLSVVREPRGGLWPVYVCVYLFGRTTYFQLSPLTQRFFIPFSVSPGAETSMA